ncbi:MAG: CusA/CzcA family heavy metal efflux RND transporter [Candidatus Binatus sp.]|jgi:Cu(I)/Ag(I) efflux system membrane protein CusA/SilA|uniref:efflux RND transporter permease subunit n=1 Tax=Candidatus Binatus sp. TaxID=2811406 RepID=UPI003D098C7B
MIERTIDWCNANRFILFAGVIALVLAGVWSLDRIPLDALPDISDVQVIIHTEWMGQPPNLIEDQVTYPIVTAMLAAPHVKAVRAQTMPSDSYVFVVFEDGTDIYWARSRVLEYLQQIAGKLPAGVNPAIGPDATGAGWVYEYALVDKSHLHSLADLRSLQDWNVRYALETVPGVSEVATIGGFVRQYQVKLDPNRLLALKVPLETVIDKIRDSNGEVGGRVLEMSGADYMIRGLGYVHSVGDLEEVSVATNNGTPVLIKDLGVVSLGPDLREGAAEWNGDGETVGGIVVMRYGQNALTVIDGVKQKLAQIRKTLPAGVEIVAGYDRSGLIQESINTLKRDLLEEAIIVSLVIIVFLFHLRSALIPILALPIAVIATFIPMYYLQISSNIMSLGGLALAIGVLVDASIVMVENGYRHLSEAQHEASQKGESVSGLERQRILLSAAKQVGRPIFFSLIIIVVSFLPVFLLESQEGRMFRPLAYTKSFAIAFSSVLAITVVPVLMVLFIRGKRLRPEENNPISRFFQAIYLPVIRWCLHHRALTIAANVIFLLLTIPLLFKIGSQFMPPLYEGSSLYMPTALPGISITSAVNLMQKQDQIIRTFPEVESVFGTVGRSDSATDNAPLDMYDTTIMLKPREQWRKGMTYDQLVAEMDDRLHFPGLSNSWTMPVENRLDMELTGIKTPVGLKIQGPDVERIQQIGSQIEEILGPVAGTRGIFAERVSQGFYINVNVDRAVAARYGLTVGDVQRAVSSGMGGENIANTVEGRERYSINVRYLADYRNDLNALRRILIMTPTGAQIPLGEIASISLGPGPSMIRDEDGLLTGYVYVDLATSDYGSYVNNAQRVLDRHLHLPAGYTVNWSGEYEFQLRARKRLTVILPIVFGLIFVLLYMLFQSATEAIVLILPTVYAMTGGLLLQYMMGFNFSVAVWVGYIALFGIAVETGVVMVIYLHEALNRRIAAGDLAHGDIELAVIEGAVQRLRPKLMTVAVVMLSLAPILWGSGIGSDVMKPIAAPIVGGMITSTIHVLILVPVFFAIMKERALKKGILL